MYYLVRTTPLEFTNTASCDFDTAVFARLEPRATMLSLIWNTPGRSSARREEALGCVRLLTKLGGDQNPRD